MIYTPYYNNLVRYFELNEAGTHDSEFDAVKESILDYQNREPDTIELTDLDKAIIEALESISVAEIPAMLNGDGKLIIPDSTEYPACIYDTEAKEKLGDNGQLTKRVVFYFFSQRTQTDNIDILYDVNPKQEIHSKKIIDFRKEILKSKFKIVSISEIQAYHDQTTALEVGKEVTIEFSYSPC